jgi:hypothetical protein
VIRLLAVGLGAALVLAACSSAPHYAGKEIDGFLVDGERPCAMPPGDDCAPQLAVALAQLTLEERSAVRAAAIGSEPGSYVDGDGQTILLSRAGLTTGYPVIIDIAGEPRRVISIVCGRLQSPAGKAPVNGCEYSPDSLMRVGNAPVR